MFVPWIMVSLLLVVSVADGNHTSGEPAFLPAWSRQSMTISLLSPAFTVIFSGRLLKGSLEPHFLATNRLSTRPVSASILTRQPDSDMLRFVKAMAYQFVTQEKRSEIEHAQLIAGGPAGRR